MGKPPLRVLLAQPRGFCAGVERAIEIVERALERFGPPVYVRHEIVHNRHVVEDLKRKGARFVAEVDEIPPGAVTVFSAHGVAEVVESAAGERGLRVIDAACPLVTKVHAEGQRYASKDYDVVLIGHAGHPEVEGTMGRIRGTVHLISSVGEVAEIAPADPERVAFVTQTTLSVDDTAQIAAALKTRFPEIAIPHKEDICYATTNRQEAVKVLAPGADLVLVVGSEASSNSKRLVEVALRAGAKDAKLVSSVNRVDWTWFEGVSVLGLTAGASAPESLVQDLIDACAARFDAAIDEIVTSREDVTFKLPRVLAE